MPKKKLTIKEKFEALVLQQGFRSMNQFAHACGLESSNLYTNLKEKYRPEIKRMFVFANTLGVPIGNVIEVWYSDELKENHKAVQAKEKTT